MATLGIIPSFFRGDPHAQTTALLSRHRAISGQRALPRGPPAKNPDDAACQSNPEKRTSQFRRVATGPAIAQSTRTRIVHLPRQGTHGTAFVINPPGSFYEDPSPGPAAGFFDFSTNTNQRTKLMLTLECSYQ